MASYEDEELKCRELWEAYCRGDMPQLGIKPDDIPDRPDLVYKDQGWVSWQDWLEVWPTILAIKKSKPSLIN